MEAHNATKQAQFANTLNEGDTVHIKYNSAFSDTVQEITGEVVSVKVSEDEILGTTTSFRFESDGEVYDYTHREGTGSECLHKARYNWSHGEKFEARNGRITTQEVDKDAIVSMSKEDEDEDETPTVEGVEKTETGTIRFTVNDPNESYSQGYLAEQHDGLEGDYRLVVAPKSVGDELHNAMVESAKPFGVETIDTA